MIPSRSLGDRGHPLVGGKVEFDSAGFAVDGLGVAVRSDGLIAEGAVDRDHRGAPFQLFDAGSVAPLRDT
jgi:hypothetical protein